MDEIEIIYLRFPVHPNITVIQTGPGIDRIVREGDSYWIYGTPDGPLAGKKVEIPLENVAALQWNIGSEPAVEPVPETIDARASQGSQAG